jgi:hypothetical protein
MKTLKEIRDQLEIEYPTLSESNNGEERQLSAALRKITLDQWAANILAVAIGNQATLDKEAAKVSALSKLAALGLTQDEVEALIP